jgi:3-hydroxyisobutyrate dehydrogenase-like beta-hydroxyacid dehydrogenase
LSKASLNSFRPGMSRNLMEDVKLKRIGIIGLGAIGIAFARHIVAAGFAVQGYDIDPARMALAEGLGVTALASGRAACENAETVIVMVQDDAQLESLFVHDDLTGVMPPGAVLCIASSVSPQSCIAVAAAAACHAVGVLDTPVVLGQAAADRGQSTIFVGGNVEDLEKARPVLEAFSGEIFHLGPVGAGQYAKSVNNILLWACMSANFEALRFARKVGMDMPRLLHALQHSSAANWSLAKWGNSTGKWAKKDIEIALALAAEAGTELPLTREVAERMKDIDQPRMRALLESRGAGDI